MKKILTLLIIAVAAMSCSHAAKPLPSQEASTIKEKLRKVQDSLKRYKNMPHLFAKNPLNSDDSVMVMNGASLALFRKRMKNIELYGDTLLGRWYHADRYITQDVMRQDKEAEILNSFKKNNPALYRKWAYQELDTKLNIQTTDETEYEQSPEYLAAQKKIEMLENVIPSDTAYTKAYSDVERIKKVDQGKAWEKFLKSN